MATLFSLLPGAWFTDNCVVILPTGGGGSEVMRKASP